MTQNLTYIELALVALATPFLLFPNRLTILSVALIIVSWAIRWVRLRRTSQFSIPTAMNLPAGLLLAATVAATYPSVDLVLSSSKVWGIFLGVAIFFAIVNCIHSLKELWLMMWGLFLVGVLVSALSLVGTDWHGGALVQLPFIYDNIPTLIRGIPGSGLSRPTDLFNAREVGGTTAMLLPIGLAAALMANNRAAKITAIIGALFIGLVLILSQSPSAIAGAGFAFLILIAAWYGHLRLLPAALSGLFLIIAPPLLLYLVFQGNAPSGAEEARSSFGIQARVEIWGSGLSMLRDMPFTGIGINTFPLIFDGFYPTLSLGGEPHAHNMFLQVALDLGIFGLLAFLWLLMSFYFSIVSAYKSYEEKNTRIAAVALGASITAYLIFGSIDAITLGAKPGPAMWAVFALAGALTSLRVNNSFENSGVPGNRALPSRASGNVRPFESLKERATHLFSSLRGAGRTRMVDSSSKKFHIALAAIGGVLFIPLVLHASSGGLWLNLGLLDAHKGIVESRSADTPSVDILTRAENRLVGYLSTGRDEYSAYTHLSSVQGWLGENEESVESMRYAAATAWTGFPHIRSRQPTNSAGNAPKTEQRARDILYILDQWSVRYPTRWEVYLLKAGFLYYELNDLEQAKSALREGMDKAQIKGPLEHLGRQMN